MCLCISINTSYLISQTSYKVFKLLFLLIQVITENTLIINANRPQRTLYVTVSQTNWVRLEGLSGTIWFSGLSAGSTAGCLLAGAETLHYQQAASQLGSCIVR